MLFYNFALTLFVFATIESKTVTVIKAKQKNNNKAPGKREQQ